MDAALQILPTPAGLALAAIAVALGAPLFSDGLRAFRLRRHLAALAVTPLTPSTNGFSHARGNVALESPLFSPLGGEPCAGFQLEIEGEGRSVRRRIEVRRPFRIVDGDVSARVPAGAGSWVLEATATRRIAADEPLSENLAALLGRVPEAIWLRRAGAVLRLTEYALVAGRECHVVGVARSAAAVAYATELEVARTGTDDAIADAEPLMMAAPAATSMSRSAAARADVAFSSGEHLDFLLVSDRAPGREHLAVPALRVVGLVLGPALSMAGILYLAAVADALRAAGRM